jgi:hypothetical protein
MTTTRLDPERDMRVLELSRQGFTTAQIGVMLGITRRSVGRARARHAAVHDMPPRFTAAEKARAQAFLEDGAGYVEVAETLGRNTGTIRHNVPGYNWTPHQKAQKAALVRLGKTLGL